MTEQAEGARSTGRRASDKFTQVLVAGLIAASGTAFAKGLDIIEKITDAMNALTTQVAVLEQRTSQLESRKCR